jgi:hypothetical protein
MSFFERLHYDVRVHIYTFLALSPLSPLSTEAADLEFSCRAVLQELREEAVKPAKQLLADIEARTRESVHRGARVSRFAEDDAQLRHLTVHLPIEVIEYLGRETPYVALREDLILPLMALRIDNATLLFHAEGGAQIKIHGQQHDLIEDERADRIRWYMHFRLYKMLEAIQTICRRCNPWLWPALGRITTKNLTMITPYKRNASLWLGTSVQQTAQSQPLTALR